MLSDGRLAAGIPTSKDLKRQIAIAEKLDGRTATQSFTMAINGTVDAAVNGGIANYAPFLNGSFREDHPEIAEDIASTEEKSKMLDDLRRLLRVLRVAKLLFHVEYLRELLELACSCQCSCHAYWCLASV